MVRFSLSSCLLSLDKLMPSISIEPSSHSIILKRASIKLDFPKYLRERNHPTCSRSSDNTYFLPRIDGATYVIEHRDRIRWFEFGCEIFDCYLSFAGPFF